MTRKTFNLVVEIVGGVSAIAIGAVTYFGVPYRLQSILHGGRNTMRK